MKTRYKIIITEQDCADGVRNSERFCVVSTAIQRQIRGATHVQTNVHTVRFTLTDPETGKKYRFVYITPPVVGGYVHDYDDGVEPNPMDFVIDNPEITEKVPSPKGRAKTPSFKAQGAAKSRRSVRIFGEKAFKKVD